MTAQSSKRMSSGIPHHPGHLGQIAAYIKCPVLVRPPPSLLVWWHWLNCSGSGPPGLMSRAPSNPHPLL
ncbi:hypothetical protein XELAEV_18010161mg [Xenopus laevis]|uniref:Uncharacterized protein n=1 Tax=Xenopus laevis TaxID=8355 RepID=A0A974DW31_XENLA|nr:hypothetical protein XELAEV_18010161mg [Xenopus laevis]